jgi:uncharacterized membrane protein
MPIHSGLYFLIAAIILGVVAGMRSMMPLAALSILLWRRPEIAPVTSPAHWFAVPPLAIIFGLAALGELIGDKLPKTPNRTALGPFVGRLASGALTGAALVQLGGVNPWVGAGCGAAGALASTFGMFHARRFVGRLTGIRDPYVGAMEDVIAIALVVGVLATLLG